ncbi:ferro-O2-oxidoreductase [Cordyceps militaris CM01]|uniref:Ferro-O2-oxidoreductase n=1 Tax=Cordyceps militaris (strain CM01) TaxID=983644 RepID=G3JTD1_CORMM|nr:ferro-O2-oxidoreductase [Cordyceps militaris CM01]EGX88278.1 ferro-O2-oxidoreductase [Cordyceps militaris CM01]
MYAPVKTTRLRQARSPRLSSLCGGLVVLAAATLLCYVVVALRYAHTLPLPFSRLAVPPSAADASNASNVAVADHDRFTLHPELHVARPRRTLVLDWTITREKRRPDGVLRDVYLINGQFPGPTIEARSGDELQITVTNNILNDTDAGISMHWHGLFMKDANEMDGATGVTQCAVAEGQSFTYTFHIDPAQHGTYWYHAHSAVKRADGLYGGLVIHKPADEGTGHTDQSRHEYDAERLLLIGDWYHRDADTVLGEYKNRRNFAYEPVPDSLLINGVGSYKCSNARPARPIDCVETEVPALAMVADKAVRLRVVNTGAAAGLSFQLQNGTVQLLTVDGGGYVADDTPQTPTIGVLYPGERMDVLLLPGDTPADDEHVLDTQMKIVLDAELMPMKNWALTRIQDFPLTWRRRSTAASLARRDVRPAVAVFNMKDAHGAEVPPDAALHRDAAETALLYTSLSINNFKKDEPWGEVNHTSWVWKDPRAKPLLALDADAWADGTEQANTLRTFRAPWYRDGHDRWMDLVVNNVDDKGHPFHLHGYAFHVIGARQLDLGRSYNPYEPGATQAQAQFFNTKTPRRKDTVYIESHGYVVLRFPLDNVGVWLMHCHVLWHQAVGMGVVLQVGNVTAATKQRAGDSCIA